MSNTFTNVHNVHFSYANAVDRAAAVYGQEAVGKYVSQRDSGQIFVISAVSSAGAATYTSFLPMRPGVVKVALTASDAAAGLFSWQNTFGIPILITRLTIYMTTKTTGACTGDFGVAATAILNDTLIDGLDLNTGTAPLIYDNIDTVDNGTNGRSRAICPAGGYVTGSVASGASAGIVGSVFIEYQLTA